MKLTQFNFDKLNCAEPRQVAKAAYTVINAIQHFDPHVQVAGLVAAHIAISEALNLRPTDALHPVDRLMTDPIAGKRAEFRAMGAYIRGEITA